MVRSRSETSKRKDRVAHIRFSPTEFDALKAALCSAPVLILPDPTKPFVLNCDSCA